MLVLPVIQIFLPFLQLIPRADAQSRVELRQRSLHFACKLGIAHDAGGFDDVREQVGDDLLGHGSAGRERAMFGRIARRHDKRAVAIFTRTTRLQSDFAPSANRDWFVTVKRTRVASPAASEQRFVVGEMRTG